ncbi:MAG: DUF547 domain-containing protein [Halosimplex sp.]
MGESDPLALVDRLLGALRRGEETGPLETRLAALSSERLAAALDSDRERRAFWLNAHNAYVQLLLLRDPRAYDRRSFSARDRVPVAGEWLSLDDVVHGLLRRSRWKYGLGYVPRPFVDPFERVHRVDERDWRVLAALNRGTVDCPPVAVYDPERIDDQLDAAAEAYLSERVGYDPTRDRVRVPSRLLAHVGDLGGPSGLRAALRSYGAIPDDAEPSIRPLRTDHRLDPGRWADGWGDPDG